MSSFTANRATPIGELQSCEIQRDVAADTRQQDDNMKRQTLSSKEPKFLNHVIHDRSMKHNPAFDDQLKRLAASKLATPVGEVGSRRIDHEFSRSPQKLAAISEESNAECQRVKEREATLESDADRDVAAHVRQEGDNSNGRSLSKQDRKFANRVIHDPSLTHDLAFDSRLNQLARAKLPPFRQSALELSCCPHKWEDVFASTKLQARGRQRGLAAVVDQLERLARSRLLSSHEHDHVVCEKLDSESSGLVHEQDHPSNVKDVHENLEVRFAANHTDRQASTKEDGLFPEQTAHGRSLELISAFDNRFMQHNKLTSSHKCGHMSDERRDVEASYWLHEVEALDLQEDEEPRRVMIRNQQQGLNSKRQGSRREEGISLDEIIHGPFEEENPVVDERCMERTNPMLSTSSDRHEPGSWTSHFEPSNFFRYQEISKVLGLNERKGQRTISASFLQLDDNTGRQVLTGEERRFLDQVVSDTGIKPNRHFELIFYQLFVSKLPVFLDQWRTTRRDSPPSILRLLRELEYIDASSEEILEMIFEISGDVLKNDHDDADEKRCIVASFLSFVLGVLGLWCLDYHIVVRGILSILGGAACYFLLVAFVDVQYMIAASCALSALGLWQLGWYELCGISSSLCATFWRYRLE